MQSEEMVDTARALMQQAEKADSPELQKAMRNAANLMLQSVIDQMNNIVYASDDEEDE